MTIGSGVVVSAAAGSWGTSGKNGGTVVLTADGQTLPGDMTADSISSIAATLKNSSKLTGKLTKVSADARCVEYVDGHRQLDARGVCRFRRTLGFGNHQCHRQRLHGDL